MGAPIGNRNAAGSRGGKKGKVARRTMPKSGRGKTKKQRSQQIHERFKKIGSSRKARKQIWSR